VPNRDHVVHSHFLTRDSLQTSPSPHEQRTAAWVTPTFSMKTSSSSQIQTRAVSHCDGIGGTGQFKVTKAHPVEQPLRTRKPLSPYQKLRHVAIHSQEGRTSFEPLYLFSQLTARLRKFSIFSRCDVRCACYHWHSTRGPVRMYIQMASMKTIRTLLLELL